MFSAYNSDSRWDPTGRLKECRNWTNRQQVSWSCKGKLRDDLALNGNSEHNPYLLVWQLNAGICHIPMPALENEHQTELSKHLERACMMILQCGVLGLIHGIQKLHIQHCIILTTWYLCDCIHIRKAVVSLPIPEWPSRYGLCVWLGSPSCHQYRSVFLQAMSGPRRTPSQLFHAYLQRNQGCEGRQSWLQVLPSSKGCPNFHSLLLFPPAQRHFHGWCCMLRSIEECTWILLSVWQCQNHLMQQWAWQIESSEWAFKTSCF